MRDKGAQRKSPRKAGFFSGFSGKHHPFKWNHLNDKMMLKAIERRCV
jgi:hypothetical protein